MDCHGCSWRKACLGSIYGHSPGALNARDPRIRTEDYVSRVPNPADAQTNSNAMRRMFAISHKHNLFRIVRTHASCNLLRRVPSSESGAYVSPQLRATQLAFAQRLGQAPLGQAVSNQSPILLLSLAIAPNHTTHRAFGASQRARHRAQAHTGRQTSAKLLLFASIQLIASIAGCNTSGAKCCTCT